MCIDWHTELCTTHVYSNTATTNTAQKSVVSSQELKNSFAFFIINDYEGSNLERNIVDVKQNITNPLQAGPHQPHQNTHLLVVSPIISSC